MRSTRLRRRDESVDDTTDRQRCEKERVETTCECEQCVCAYVRPRWIVLQCGSTETRNLNRDGTKRGARYSAIETMLDGERHERRELTIK